MKKLLALVMVLGVLGGVLAGCSGGDAAAADSSSSTAPAAGAEAPKSE